MSSTTALCTAPGLLTKPRKREIVFLLFGAAVFGLGLLATTVYCVACINPATVTALGY